MARPDTGSASIFTRKEKLAWPPLREDLQRLYLEQKLSASKIAKVYGLTYASDKTAESTILYHLKKNGIARRDAAGHVRKVADAMIDDWIVRYRKGESLKQIAGGDVSPATVFNNLHKRGIRLRDKVEAQILAVTRFQKSAFDGTESEQAYLLGFARGDLNVKRHGRAIRLKTSSTHPAMIESVTNMFVPCGTIRIYPRFSKLAGYEWSIEGEVDKTFDFLLLEKFRVPDRKPRKEVLLSYLAGFFDAEGSLWLWKRRTFAPRMSYTNKDLELLEWVKMTLNGFGFHCVRNGPDKKGVYRLNLWRVDEIVRLLQQLPIKHPEKKAKARLLLRHRTRSAACRSAWNDLTAFLREDRKSFVKLAEFVKKQREQRAVL